FLVLDEKFSQIDRENRTAVLGMLNKECADRKIWVISHVEGIESEFNQVVRFKNDRKTKLSTVDISYG
ncbi:MAG: hypothetical protein KAJ10_13515, partial [Thermodesulfovibrionia bacterium]|nr:hypothetical protein [Thermodesulfovibrionia bacterium]